MIKHLILSSLLIPSLSVGVIVYCPSEIFCPHGTTSCVAPPYPFQIITEYGPFTPETYIFQSANYPTAECHYQAADKTYLWLEDDDVIHSVIVSYQYKWIENGEGTYTCNTNDSYLCPFIYTSGNK